MVSARSRRLRTVGSLLLIAVIGMALYGYFSLMPRLNAAIQTYHRLEMKTDQPVRAVAQTPAAAAELERARKVHKVQIAFVMAFWGAWTLLFFALLVIAWLDAREVLHTYVQQRRAVWQDVANRTESATSETPEQ